MYASTLARISGGGVERFPSTLPRTLSCAPEPAARLLRPLKFEEAAGPPTFLLGSRLGMRPVSDLTSISSPGREGAAGGLSNFLANCSICSLDIPVAFSSSAAVLSSFSRSLSCLRFSSPGF